MTMKRSRNPQSGERRVGFVVALASLALAAFFPSPTAAAASGSRVVIDGARSARGPSARASFWPHPAMPPRGWRRGSIASGDASVSYPASWKPIPGDTGTVSFSLRDAGGAYLGYINVTPRQGAEQLHGWAQFRLRRNRAEGATRVRAVASVERLPFASATGSCVIDDYLSRVGAHPYREVACIVAGHRATSVLVGAARLSEWNNLRAVLKLAAASFRER